MYTALLFGGSYLWRGDVHGVSARLLLHFNRRCCTCSRPCRVTMFGRFWSDDGGRSSVYSPRSSLPRCRSPRYVNITITNNHGRTAEEPRNGLTGFTISPRTGPTEIRPRTELERPGSSSTFRVVYIQIALVRSVRGFFANESRKFRPRIRK